MKVLNGSHPAEHTLVLFVLFKVGDKWLLLLCFRLSVAADPKGGFSC